MAELPGAAASSTVGSCQIRQPLIAIAADTNVSVCHDLRWESGCLSLHVTQLQVRNYYRQTSNKNDKEIENKSLRMANKPLFFKICKELL